MVYFYLKFSLSMIRGLCLKTPTGRRNLGDRNISKKQVAETEPCVGRHLTEIMNDLSCEETCCRQAYSDVTARAGETRSSRHNIASLAGNWVLNVAVECQNAMLP